jgi:hypothetical protein
VKWLASISVLVTWAACAAASVALSAPDSTNAACGDIQSRLVYTIKTQRVTCRLARRIAVQWGDQCAQLRTGSCLVTALYYCRYRTTGVEEGRIKCIHDDDLRKALRLQRVVSFITAS